MSLHFRNTQTQYGLGGRVLHWSSVALLVTMIITASQFEELDPSPEKLELIKQHASWGLLFLMIMLLRFYWRVTNINPVRSYAIASWQKLAAISLHWTIYVVVITQSLTGIANLIVSGEGIPFFNLFEMPVVMAKSEFLSDLTHEIHEFIAFAIYPLFAIHISAAIYHQLFGVRDE